MLTCYEALKVQLLEHADMLQSTESAADCSDNLTPNLSLLLQMNIYIYVIYMLNSLSLSVNDLGKKII